MTALLVAAVPAAEAAGDRGPARSAASPSAATSAGELRDGEELRFRRGLGLDTSPAALRRAAADDNDAAGRFGVALTDSELAELARRDSIIRDDVPTIRTTMAEAFDTSVFAGVWMDNLGGGVLTVAVTRSATAVRDRLLDVVDNPADLRVVSRSYSLAELSRVAADIRAAAEVDGRRLRGIRVDERGNQLQVATSDGPRDTRRWVTETVGDDAPVEVAAGEVTPVGTQYNNSPPLRGGQAINSNEGYTCTSAFTARAPDGLYVLSAGHCSNTGWAWNQVGTPIGIADASDVTGTDVLRIPVTGQLLTNEVTLWYTPTLATEARYRTITSSQAASADAVGQVSCITGQNFADLRCGEIITRSYDVSIPNHDMRRLTYSNGREIDADCNPGDSGGPALRGGQARGIVSVKVRRTFGNDTCVYAHIGPAMNQIGVADVLDDGPVLGT